MEENKELAIEEKEETVKQKPEDLAYTKPEVDEILNKVQDEISESENEEKPLSEAKISDEIEVVSTEVNKEQENQQEVAEPVAHEKKQKEPKFRYKYVIFYNWTGPEGRTGFGRTILDFVNKFTKKNIAESLSATEKHVQGYLANTYGLDPATISVVVLNYQLV